jgi:large subunit ribosomal protein L9
MKIILTEEVHGLGEPGKIVDVAPGYARNFLVPRKLAVYANSTSVREMEHHKNRLERKRQRLVLAAQSVAERLQGKEVKIQARSGESGKLYGSITTADIAQALLAQYDVTVDRRKISLREPIRMLGEHSVELQLMGETRPTITVNVFDPAHVTPVAAPAPVAETAAPAAEETEA